MRLIDADALKELRHDIIQGCIEFDGNEYDIIDKCPTIDAVEVVHGRWMKHRNETKCSICKFIYYSNHDNFNYCPNCGAKMAKGENHEID